MFLIFCKRMDVKKSERARQFGPTFFRYCKRILDTLKAEFHSPTTLLYLNMFALVNDGCRDSHRTDFNAKHWIGENLYNFQKFPVLNHDDANMCKQATDATNEWYKEIQFYKYPLGGAPFHKCQSVDTFKTYSHFIQMMLSTIGKIGCSYAYCLHVDPVGIPMTKIIVNCYYDKRKLICLIQWIPRELSL